MPTTRVMTTVLPYSVDPADPFHVSLFFTGSTAAAPSATTRRC